MMDEELKALAEKYLGAAIPETVYMVAKQCALEKLMRIITREGDADGERLKPYYLAQLIAEDIQSGVLTVMCEMNFEDKKRAARKADNPKRHPHYSTFARQSQEVPAKMLWRSE